MLLLLGAFAIVPMLLPWLVARIGARAFFVAALLPVAAFVQAAVQTPAIIAGNIPFEAFDWIPSLGIELSMRMDTLSWLMALIVTGVGALVMLYCRWYFRGKTEGLGQFAAVLLAFAGAMYGLVLTDDLVVLVMFWELTSVLSYLLIGYYNRRAASRRAALQALLVTTLGGLVMLIGVVLLVVDTGTSSISTILAEAPTGPVVDAALVLLLVGALSKSAIFPFHFWLPGAMAAPTPVSAYLHAAAMVKAGIYLIARLAPVFAVAPTWRPIVIGLGVFTMLLGGFQALRESDLKRVLAFGTVSQLGLLAVVLGFGTRDMALAGLALLLSHALFKSALFLVVGVIDRQLSTRDIGELSRRRPPGAGHGDLLDDRRRLDDRAAADDRVRRQGGGARRAAARGRRRIAVGHRRLHRRRARLRAHGGVRHPLRVGRVLDEEDAAGDGRCRARSGPTRRSDSSPRPSLLSTLTVRGRIRRAAPRHRLRPVRGPGSAATPGVTPPLHPAHLALWHGLEPALWISLGTIAAGILVFARHGAALVEPARAAVHRRRRLQRRAARNRAAVGRDHELHAARFAPGLRRHDLRRLRRRRGHGPARGHRVAGAARRVPDPDAGRRRADHDRRRASSRCARASATPASSSCR